MKDEDKTKEQLINELRELRQQLARLKVSETERKRAEEEVRLLQAMTIAISEAEDFRSAMGVALRKVCEATSWVFGEAWVPSFDGTILEHSSARHSSAIGLDKFATLSEKVTFPPGRGLPGRAWTSKRPIWMHDITLYKDFDFRRSEITMEAGFKAGVAVPVFVGDEVVAVMVFFMLKPHEGDERLIGLVSTVATQLGLVIQRKRAEEALEKAHDELREAFDTLEMTQAAAITSEKLAAVGRLTAGVCHEILNPLNFITLCLQRLRNDPDHDPELAEDLRGIQEYSNRIVDITQALLSFSRQHTPERHPIDLNEVLSGTLTLLEHDMKLQNISVELNLAEDLPPILADKGQLHQVLLNLLTNASDFMPKGGRITLSTAEVEPLFEDKGKAVEIRVEDTGPGIAPEDLDKLFEPFFTTKPVGEGTGLGLSICQGIIEAHGGVIWAENAPDGGGAVFIIHLNVEGVDVEQDISS